MSGLECLPIRAELYIPENKRSAFVYKKGAEIRKDRSKEYQGVWVVEGYTPDKKKVTTEIWFFADDDEIGIDRRVLENNPLQGRWGYAPHVDLKKAKRDVGIDPNDMWFFPPESARCKIPSKMEEYIHRGTWIKPTFKRDFSKLGSNKTGFLTVSGDMRIAKGEKHSVTGKWNMMGFNDDVVRGRRKEPSNEPSGKGSYQIYVRKVNGVRFPINVIPGNKIMQCKKKIHQKKGIPIEDQRLTFNDVPLKDEKTVIGSGIRNGDTIDLNPMIIYVRNLKGKKFTFEVDPDEMVESVKKLVEKREGTPASKQRLFFKSWKLVEGKPISHFNIRHKSTLDLRGMIIYVQPIGDVPKIELEVEPTDPLKSIKLKVKHRINVSVTEQRLFFREKEMREDADTLESYDVQHLDTLFLRDDVTEEPVMVIFVIKDWDQYRFQLSVDPTNTILNVKEMIEKTEGIPVNKQILTFKRKSVYNAKTLEQSKIKNRSLLHLEASKLDNQMKRTESPRVTVRKPEKPPKLAGVVVKTPSGDFPIPFDPMDTIKEIKKKIGKELGVPPKDFKLHPTEAKDLKPLKNTDKLKPGDVLSMIPAKRIASPHILKVRAPSKTGPRTLEITVESSETMDDIARKIADITGYPVKDLQLLNHDDLVRNTDDPHAYDILDATPVVEIVTPNGKKIHLPILPTMTVENLKDVIEEKSSIPKSRQRLFFLDNETEELDNTAPLSTFVVTPGKVLTLKYPEIHARDMNGRTFTLIIDPDDHPSTTRSKIAAMAGVPTKDLHLILDGKEIPVEYVPSHNVILDIVPEIEVKVPNHSKIKLLVGPTMDVDDVKDIIEEKTGMPKSNQRIFVVDGDGQELPSDIPLSKLGVNPNSILEITPSEDEITVNLPGGRSFVLMVDPVNDSSYEVRRKIANVLGVPVKDLKLFLDGEELDPHYTPSKSHALDVASQVEVTLPGNQKTILSVLPTMKIEDIKDVIEEKTGVPKANQRIFFLDNESKELENEIPAAVAGIAPGTAVEMRPVDDCKVEMILPNGRSFFFVVDPVNESRNSLARKIAAKLGIPLKELPPILFEGDELPSDYKPSRGDILAITPPTIDVELPDKSRIQLAVMPTKKLNSLADDFVEGKPVAGRTFTLMIDPEEPLKTVKQKIREKIGFPVGDLRIDGKIWGEDKEDISLEDAGGTRTGCALAVDPPELEISLPNNKKIMMKVMPSMTVQEVKELILASAPEVSNKIQDGRIFFMDGNLELDEDTTFDRIDFASGQKLELRSMDLNVSHWDGRLLTVEAQSNWYIDDLKDCILKEIDLLQEHQRLSFQGCPVALDVQLLKQGIVHGATIQLERMSIRVQMPSRRDPMRLEVDHTDLVKDVKRSILKQSKLSLKDPFLVFGGVSLSDGDSLSQCQVQHDDLVQLEEYKVSVLMWDGGTCSVDGIKQRDLLSKVQQRLFEKHGIPLEEQKLSLSGKRLKSSGTLLDQNVSHRAVLVLEPSDVDIELPDAEKKGLKTMRRKRFGTNHEEIWPVMPDWQRRIFFFDNDETFDAFIELTVLHWSGETFVVYDVLLTTKTNELKDRIYKLNGTKKKHQKLKFNGILLKDTNSLLDQGVQHKSVLTLDSPKKNTIATPDLDRVILNTLPAKFVGEITISVRHWKGDELQLTPDPHEYIDDIKDRIADHFKLPSEHQRLIFQGSPTSDHLNLKEQGIVDGCVLELIQMEILVEIPSKKKPTTLSVEPDFTISKIKKALVKKSKLPVEMQCIMYGGEELLDSRNLSSYSIDHGEVLVLEVFKIRIVHWTGDQFDLDGMSPLTTVFEVKVAIQRLKQVPVAEQDLMLKGTALNDVLGMRDQGVLHRSVMFLQEKKSNHSKTNDTVKNKMSFRFLNSAGLIDPMKSQSSIICLHIKHCNGDVFLVKAHPTDLVEDVKEKILAKKNIPLEKQRLKFDGNVLEDGEDLESLGVWDGSTLLLGMIELQVMLPDGSHASVEVEVEDTVVRLKRRLKDLTGMAIESQFVVFEGHLLENAKKLAFFGIDHGDTIKLENYKVCVADWTGKVFEVGGIDPSCNVSDLKDQICKVWGVQPSQQTLSQRKPVK